MSGEEVVVGNLITDTCRSGQRRVRSFWTSPHLTQDYASKESKSDRWYWESEDTMREGCTTVSNRMGNLGKWDVSDWRRNLTVSLPIMQLIYMSPKARASIADAIRLHRVIGQLKATSS